VLVGTSSDQTVTVRNDGTAALILGTIGTPSSPFSRAGGTCTNGHALIPGGSCTILVRFAPTAIGLFNSSFGIPSNDPDESLVNVALSGTGIQQDIEVDRLNVDFGEVLVGTGLDQTVTVQNVGTAPLTLGTIGIPSLPFSRAGGTCVNGQILAKGASCTIILRFAPAATGPFGGSFGIPSNDPDESLVNVALSGTGIQQDITITPMSIDFGAVEKGASSDETITVRNDGTAELTLGTIGSLSSPFSRVGGTCTGSMILAPGESCSIVVRFSPVETGPSRIGFNVSSNDPDEGSLTIELRGGSGPDLTGKWLSFHKTCKPTKKGIKCNIKAQFRVENIGTDGAPPVCVRFLLESRSLLEIGTGYINKGGNQIVSPRFSLPVGESGDGKRILSVVDCCEVLTEADETNNIIPWSMGE